MSTPSIDSLKARFVEFLLESGALKFGEFTLKSGRRSPYFFNTGLFHSGARIGKLGFFYASLLRDIEPRPTLLFGPSYKGAPLAVAAAIALRSHFSIDMDYCFDRKEAKDHGEGGVWVGRAPEAGDRVAILDDVISSGATKVEATRLVRETSKAAVGEIVIALDRKERGADGEDPVAALAESAGVHVHAVATIHDVLGVLDALDNANAATNAVEIRKYLDEFGV